MSFPNYLQMGRLEKRVVPPSFFTWIRECPGEYANKITLRVDELFQGSKNPPTYLRNLLWLASQLRFRANQVNTALVCAARAIHYFLYEEVGGRQGAFAADLRWLLFVARKEMVQEFGHQIRQQYLSREEQEAVESVWLEEILSASDQVSLSGMADATETYANLLEKVNNEIHLPEVSTHIRRLVAHAPKEDESGLWARAALHYLLLEKDVLPDAWGYLGLVDDIWVLEETIEMLKEKSRWHPLVEKFVERWPFLSEIYIEENGHRQRLSGFLKFVCGAVLERLSCASNASCFVVTESGPLSFLAVLTAWLSLQMERTPQEKALPSFSMGDAVDLWSAKVNLKGQYSGIWERNGATGIKVTFATSKKLGKAKTVVIFLPQTYLRFVSRANGPHAALSTNDDYQNWLEGIKPDLMSALLNQKTSYSQTPVIMWILRRKKLEHFLDRYLPMGQSLHKVLGLNYLTRRGVLQVWEKGRHAHPQIIACSDALLARKYLEGSLSDINVEKPALVIVDEPALVPDLTRMAESERPSLVVFSETSDREALVDGENYFGKLISLSNEHAPSEQGPRTNLVDHGSMLHRFMLRQYLGPRVHHETLEIRQEGLARVHQLLQDIRDQYKDDPDILGCAIQIFLELRKQEYRLVPPSRKERESHVKSIEVLLQAFQPLFRYCSLLRDLETELKALFSNVHEWPYDRTESLQNALNTFTSKPNPIGLVFRNRQRSGASDLEKELPEHITLLQPRELGEQEIFHTLIVGNWLGRRHLRRILAGGYARNVFYVFFPHEHRWLNGLRAADQAFQTKMGQSSQTLWTEWEQTYGVSLTRNTSSVTQDASGGDDPEGTDETLEVPPIDFESWVETLVHRQVLEQTDKDPAEKVLAHLVMFEASHYFFCGYPKTRVPCVSDLEEDDDRGSQESQLLRPVDHLAMSDWLAFPIDRRGDVISMLADRFLDNPSQQRQTARRWREALEAYFNDLGGDLDLLRRNLANGGLKRKIQTLRLWLDSGTMIAPRDEGDLELIAKITRHPSLWSELPEVKQAIAAIYSARREAIGHFYTRLRAMDLEGDEEELTVPIAGKPFHFRLLRVLNVQKNIRVPRRWVGHLLDGLPFSKRELSEGAVQ